MDRNDCRWTRLAAITLSFLAVACLVVFLALIMLTADRAALIVGCVALFLGAAAFVCSLFPRKPKCQEPRIYPFDEGA